MLDEIKPSYYESEILIPPILYKLSLPITKKEAPSTVLLPFYSMPIIDTLNTWIMYLESILKDVFSVEGSEQILLEAYIHLAI
jgi:hypothetical protein